MTLDQLKPNKILRGPLFAEPVEVIVTVPMAGAVKLTTPRAPYDPGRCPFDTFQQRTEGEAERAMPKS